MTYEEQQIINQALAILDSRIKAHEFRCTEPQDAKNYLRLKMEGLEHEIFSVLFLNNRHQVLEYKELFRGTINAASVYPREVVKEALNLNAAAVIFSHNHPSGISLPSDADIQITKVLKDILKVVEVNVLDHIIVGKGETYSLAEHHQI